MESSPAVANGVVYAASFDSNVYALDAGYGGYELWSFVTGGPLISSPTVANGAVYVGSLDHNVYAFSLGGGQPVRAGQKAGGQQLRPPARPALSALHPDPNLKPSQPAVNLPSNAYRD